MNPTIFFRRIYFKDSILIPSSPLTISFSPLPLVFVTFRGFSGGQTSLLCSRLIERLDFIVFTFLTTHGAAVCCDGILSFYCPTMSKADSRITLLRLPS